MIAVERKWTMFYKSRKESKELTIFRSLDARMELGQPEQQQFFKLKKGFEGEVRFDSLVGELSDKFLILNDLLLESNQSTFQIDSLFITQQLLIPSEIKFFEGNYFYENDNFYTCTTKKEITNPLHQLNRVETLLRQFLQKKGYAVGIKGHLIFIHPEFFLYQAPQNEKIIYWPQWNSFFKYLHEQPSKLGRRHYDLAEFLVDSHQTENPYAKIPAYQYEQLQKGIVCGECWAFMEVHNGRNMICKSCGVHEKIEVAVVRSVKEFRNLFPEERVTTNAIHDWCGMIFSKVMIGNILKRNFKVRGYGQWTYYE